MLRTALTERLGLRHPIVQAPMGGVAGVELATAVSRAGALGMLTAGPNDGPEKIEREAAQMTERFAIGTLAWRLDQDPEILDAAIAAAPAAISISAGQIVPHAARVVEAGIPLLVQVSTADGARCAVAAGAQFVVAQGTDAGGHTGSVPTLPLLEAVLAQIDEVPVLAAGGIATGRGLAGVIAMGCAGAWIGTRFFATQEALGDDARKQRLLDARESDTIHTRAFDVAQRLDWPAEFPGRALRDDFAERWHGREDEIPDGYEGGHVYAGAAVGAITDVPPAGDLVERLVREAEARLAAIH
jgi:nitronate monooxygenase